jgi:hypothetical protein
MADQHKGVSQADTFYCTSGHGAILRCAFNHTVSCPDKMTMIYVLHVNMPVFFYGLSLLVMMMSQLLSVSLSEQIYNHLIGSQEVSQE